jgi:glucuronate isomerase
MLLELAQLDHAKGWVQQFHLGRYRHAMAGMMGQEEEGHGSYRTEAKSVFGLASFLSRLNDLGRFPHTIIHSLPMSGDEAIVALCRDFRDDLEAGCIRFGAGWSGCDRLDVMTRRIRMIAESDHLSQLVGPASDSGSISGLVRHDYFRRLLCRVLGQDMANGLLPDDEELVGRLVADVCYGNAQRNFRFPQRKWGVHDAASQRMLCKG